jgi:hypothetical protein
MRRWLATVTKAKEKIPATWSVLREMLDFDSKVRITAAQLVQRLKTTTISDRVDSRQLLEA